MLGTGKGCVKPPDIFLHGSHVAPQHAFVERLSNEAVLHPISEETSIDGRHIKGPTPLRSGKHVQHPQKIIISLWSKYIFCLPIYLFIRILATRLYSSQVYWCFFM